MKMRYLVLAGALVGGMMLFTVLSDQGLLGLYRLEQEKARLELRLAQLQAENERLRAEIERLKNDPAYLEKVAREELGMVQQDELVFQFKSEPAPAPAAP